MNPIYIYIVLGCIMITVAITSWICQCVYSGQLAIAKDEWNTNHESALRFIKLRLQQAETPDIEAAARHNAVCKELRLAEVEVEYLMKCIAHVTGAQNLVEKR